MGRGGGGGGGRSSGGGHSRSSGGRSSSSSHRGGSSMGSSHSRSGGFSSGGGGYRPSIHYNYHGPAPYGPGGYRRPYRPLIRISTIVWIFVIIYVLAALFGVLSFIGSAGGGASGISKSTLERTKLEAAAAFDRDCVYDGAGWIENRNTVITGMEYFYKATGVQPALVIVTDTDGEEMSDYADAMYDQLLGNEQGVLLVFCEWSDSVWDTWYVAGSASQTVMDSEACDILLDYVEAYYTSSMSDDEYFAAVFHDTADRIMSVTPTVATRMPMIVGGVVAVAVIAGVVVALKMKFKRDKEIAEETERILHTPVDRL